MVWVSAKHLSMTPIKSWSLDYKIDVFASRIDDWHLKVADRCINGWEIDGEPCINTVLDYRPDLEMQQFHYIPHSGWAALQIVLGYFETIAYFKQGDSSKLSKHGELFKWGVDDVFPDFKDSNPKLRNALWGELRGGLYHSGIAKSRIFIGSDNENISVRYDSVKRYWLINPHEFVKGVRKHFRDYIAQLRDETNTTIRQKFNEAFDGKYLR